VRVRWLRRALANLLSSAAYVAERDPAAAARIAARLEAAVRELARHPAMGRPGRVAGTRELVVPGTPYVVPYRVVGEEIQILRVFHGAQRWPDEIA
jgi:addiction module RelE/StbE family toxin